MSIHVLRSVQLVPVPLEECWDFFSDARNLAKITPPTLDLQVQGDLPAKVYEGMAIQYRLRPLFGIRTSWLTEITHVDPLRYFADDQRIGPYRLWHHEHFFRSMGDSEIEMRDCVHYALPFGILGDIVHAAFVRREVERIFAYRRAAIERLFPKPSSSSSSSSLS